MRAVAKRRFRDVLAGRVRERGEAFDADAERIARLAEAGIVDAPVKPERAGRKKKKEHDG